MSTQTIVYVAKQGDWLAKIAEEHGTTWQAIWSHPNNTEHRAKRGSPDVLYPGDVLHIPVCASPSPGPVEPPQSPREPPLSGLPASPPSISDPGDPADAPWPYEDETDLRPTPAPTWECPEGICVCGDHEEDELLEHSLLFCEQNGARMPGARCRVLSNGHCLNRQTPYADAHGWVTLEVRRAPMYLTVEWAPADTPVRQPYPFRRRYYAISLEDAAAVAGERRLANLGFVAGSDLAERVRSFQRRYDYTAITGELSDIEPELQAYHDAACLPVVAPGHANLPRSEAPSDRPLPRVPPSPPPGPPPSRGYQKVGGGVPPGQGTVCPQQHERPYPCHFSFVLHKDLDGSLVADEPYELHLHDGTIHEGVVSSDGLIEYGDVPAGDYLLCVGRLRMMVPAIPKTVLHRPLRVVSQK